MSDETAERRTAYQRKVDQQPSIKEIREALADGEMMARQDPNRWGVFGARITDVLNRIPNLARLGDVDDIDAAWAEAEAALPKGWEEITLTRWRQGGVGKRYVGPVQYTAAASYWRDPLIDDGPAETIDATAATPSAALRGLAAKLRGEG